MATKTIPAQTIKTCDCCDAVITRDGDQLDGYLKVNSNATDIHGHVVGSANLLWDLCDGCVCHIKEAVFAVRSKRVSKKAT